MYMRCFLRFTIKTQMTENEYLGVIGNKNVQNCSICVFSHDTLRLTDDIVNSLMM